MYFLFQKYPQEVRECYRNLYTRPAPASEMEADITMEGFIEAERGYKLFYTQFVGDRTALST